MSSVASLRSSVSSTCEVIVPSPDSELHSIVSRWSDAGVSLPAAVVVPSSEDDIVAAVNFAAQNGFQLIPAGGGHGSFVPINNRTVYMDMKNFRSVEVDKSAGSVTFGGGATTGEVLWSCATNGLYAAIPNSNAVGVAGAFLGGGSSNFNAFHGFMIDNLILLDIITASGSKLTLTPSSSDTEGELLWALRGGGFGFGIIVSLTLKAYPLAELGITDNKIWRRRLIFSAGAISTAAELYTKLLPPAVPLAPVLAFARAPPNSPAKGAPSIVLTITCFSPAAEAENAAAAALGSDATEQAVSAETMLVPLEEMNDGVAMLNAHGGFKEYYTCMLEQISATSIVKAFEQWRRFWEETGTRTAGSYNVIGSWNTDELLRIGSRNMGAFPWRRRGIFVQATPTYHDAALKERAEVLGHGLMEVLRGKDTEKGRPKAGLANNMKFGQDLEELWERGTIEKLRRLRQVWDKEGIFWSPVSRA
ncbi:MAG: hypothetical protein Q9160_000871 [Pyrenula sp. 1 TL-2023]